MGITEEWRINITKYSDFIMDALKFIEMRRLIIEDRHLKLQAKLEQVKSSNNKNILDITNRIVKVKTKLSKSPSCTCNSK